MRKKQKRMKLWPVASRPYMPGYGILDAKSGKGLLPWSWAVKRLSEAHNYWVATVRKDGQPHLTAVWGVLLKGKFYFSSSAQSLKAKNILSNPNCAISSERGDEAVILEGHARRLKASAIPKDFFKAYKKKYDWDIDLDQGPIFTVRPRKVFGFIEAAEDFAGTATRWIFTNKKTHD